MRPLIAQPYAVFVAGDLAPTLTNDPISAWQCMQTASRFGVDWIYVSAQDSSERPLVSHPFHHDESGVVRFNNRDYYEDVRDLGNGNVLHVGVSADPSWDLHLLPIQIAILLLCQLAFATLLIQSLVLRPLRKLVAATNEIQTGEERQDIAEVARDAFAMSEIRALATRLDNMMRASTSEAESKWKPTEQWKRINQQQKSTVELMAAPASKSSAEHAFDPMDSHLAEAYNFHEFGSLLLDKLSEDFPSLFKHGALLLSLEGKPLTVMESCGLGDEDEKALSLANHDAVVASGPGAHYWNIGGLQMRRFGLLVSQGFSRAIYFKIGEMQKIAAYVMVLVPSEVVTDQIDLANVDQLVKRFWPAVRKLALGHLADEARGTDALTGLGNRQLLRDWLARQEMQRSTMITVLCLAPSDSADKFQTNEVVDIRQLLAQEMAKRISETVLALAWSTADYCLVRSQEVEFMIGLRSASEEVLARLTKALRNSFLSPVDVLDGAVLTPYMGLATVSGAQAGDLERRARLACCFAIQGSNGSTLCHFEEVPREFRPHLAVDEMTGKLGVLSTGGLLQTVATSRKTGQLKVLESSGREFSMTWRDGKPVSANVGRVSGFGAIVEFVLTFDDGAFVFRASEISLEPNAKSLPPIERCLMEAALVEDNWKLAREVITSLDCLITVVDTPASSSRREIISSGQALEYTSKEILLMEEFLRVAGHKKLSWRELMVDLPQVATPIKWHIAALLKKEALIEERDARNRIV